MSQNHIVERGLLKMNVIKKILEQGPTRVLINTHEAANPQAASSLGIEPDVIFVRSDGWSLGAPSYLEVAARRMWSDMWVALSRKPFEDIELISS